MAKRQILKPGKFRECVGREMRTDKFADCINRKLARASKACAKKSKATAARRK